MTIMKLRLKNRQSLFGTARLLSIKLCACRNVVIYHQKMKLFLALFLMNSGKKHTTGINAHHSSRRKICDCDTGLADKLLRLIISVNTAEDRSVLACSVVKCELKKLLRLRYCNTLFNLIGVLVLSIHFFVRRYNQHHGTAHFILHPRNIHHVFRRLRLHNMIYYKTI